MTYEEFQMTAFSNERREYNKYMEMLDADSSVDYRAFVLEQRAKLLETVKRRLADYKEIDEEEKARKKTKPTPGWKVIGSVIVKDTMISINLMGLLIVIVSVIARNEVHVTMALILGALLYNEGHKVVMFLLNRRVQKKAKARFEALKETIDVNVEKGNHRALDETIH